MGSGYGDSGLVLTTPDGAVWSARQPAGIGNLKAVAWTGRRLVAAGDRGILATSEDGETWTTPWKPRLQWASLAHSPAGYVAVGSYRWNDAAVAISADGRDWEFVDLGKEPGLRKVLWHGSQFVAVGDSGRIFTSPDGRAWTRRASGTTEELQQLASSGSLLIAAGAMGARLTSADGIQWTALNPAWRIFRPNLIWAGNRFLLFGDSVYASAAEPGFLERAFRPTEDFPARRVDREKARHHRPFPQGAGTPADGDPRRFPGRVAMEGKTGRPGVRPGPGYPVIPGGKRFLSGPACEGFPFGVNM